jgi:histidyl-tRNA synthetase
MQCDFDTIGTTSIASDIETTLVIHDLFRALGFEAFTIHINNRLVLTGLLERLELADRATRVLRALDKLGKIGPEKVAEELIGGAETTEMQAREIVALAKIEGTNAEILAQVSTLVAGSEKGKEGVEKLSQLLAATEAAGVAAERINLDVSIARGLDYYTGTIYETFLDALPEIGSVCSGGRYDNLAALYTNQQLPGIGASLGLDRLLAAMEKLGLLEKIGTTAPVFLAYFVENRLHDYLRLAASLRAAGLGVELYPEAKRLGNQLKYADRRGFRVAIVIGEDEFTSGICQIKNLRTSTSTTVNLEADAIIAAIRPLVGE